MSFQTAAILILAVVSIIFLKRWLGPQMPKMQPESAAIVDYGPATQKSPAAVATVPPSPTMPANEASSNPAAIQQIKTDANLQSLRDIEACLVADDHCGIANSNPRAVSDFVVKQIDARLDAVIAEMKALSPTDRLAAGDSLRDMASYALQFDDDNVRDRGLQLARDTFSPREKVPAVVTTLEKSTSAPLFDEGLQILAEAQPKGPDRQTEDFLMQTLSDGSALGAEEVAKHSAAFMTDGNINRWREAAEQAAPESNIRLYILENIKEKQRLNGGG